MRRLPISETLQMDLGAGGLRTFGLGWGYNAHGDVASLAYPDGYAVSYSPNALGQPTRVLGSIGGSVASGVYYYLNAASDRVNLLQRLKRQDRDGTPPKSGELAVI